MKILLVANMNCRGKMAGKAGETARRALALGGNEVCLVHTREPADLSRLLTPDRSCRIDAVVAIGGDGTNYSMLNAVLRSGKEGALPALGILPLGRGNSFARDLGIRSFREGLQAVLSGKTRKVDVCRFSQNGETHHFVNLMGVGFVADVAETAARFSRAGDLSYVIGVLHRSAALRFHKMELEIDGNRIEERNCFVEFCNSRYTGGRMIMAPGARIDDGLFDAVIVKPLPALALLRTFPGIYKGRHLAHPAVRVIRGRTARLRTDPVRRLLPDGERFGKTPTEIRVLPAWVNYFGCDGSDRPSCGEPAESGSC